MLRNRQVLTWPGLPSLQLDQTPSDSASRCRPMSFYNFLVLKRVFFLLRAKLSPDSFFRDFTLVIDLAARRGDRLLLCRVPIPGGEEEVSVAFQQSTCERPVSVKLTAAPVQGAWWWRECQNPEDCACR